MRGWNGLRWWKSEGLACTHEPKSDGKRGKQCVFVYKFLSLHTTAIELNWIEIGADEKKEGSKQVWKKGLN